MYELQRVGDRPSLTSALSVKDKSMCALWYKYGIFFSAADDGQYLNGEGSVRQEG
jgi:hypothetical protein